MSIELNVEMQQLVAEQLATGRYATATDVLHAALLQLRETADTDRELYAALKDETAGRVCELADFVAGFRATHPASPVP